ncbi:cysteine desulfurase sulfur acceptor subunit CsdE [Yersinia massiliensis]|uniref:Cysteine desulfurase sulfur acceptor subunit CsdE n=1 Tax=Yersinia massiliensis TaxID=419257 RepID=A0AA90YBU3_9GAMM|nr:MULTISPECIES: cysteine desulfurase sulfur acceptor subunit CsdE [Yersinia]MDA5549525.1 cysteine desulfurase sulfur acceptor subunit CsdE [Yersinia massiliensis]NIL28241.1 cysteine desulfurase sulfur acceptor subunit CsdE [Yersinia massiliensis]PHZ22887.1 cysteine desulfurase sulfur acceptor subunit CsdE [Yersinia massiliensis]UZM80016.1 cysteine desulfurase sulfur acceptor subunit CsdE [Yersinia massiliensis]CFR21109.1 cysteine desulfurase [Yersinia frederiksenii]
MIAPHPFGHEITAAHLIETFSADKQWEDRYRRLILLAKQLPPLPASLKQNELELTGCENRVWLGHQRQPDGRLHFYGDSEGRIVRGLLAVILTAVEGKTPQQVLAEDPLELFDKLGLRQQLSTSRASGLQALAQGIKTIAAQYIEG